jgi:hypothetical protein
VFHPFDEAYLLGTPKESLAVETLRHRMVRNYIAPPPDQQHISAYYKVIRRGRAWKMRKHAVGGYNCAGMVWASRRTALTHPEDWQMILDDDGYRRLLSGELVEIGDIVVYRRRSAPEILHVAKVCRVDTLTTGSQPHGRVVRALSKWDQKCGEDIHAIEDVFLEGGEPFNVEFWTDRPKDPSPFVATIPEILT